MRVLQHIKQLLRPSNQTFIAANALIGRFKHPVWVIGAGRSGTTWLCNLMCSRHKYRFLFEPFHPSHNPEAKFLPEHYYLKPGESNPKLDKLAKKVFNGSAFFPNSDPANKHKLFDGLLVKDITANLFAYSLRKINPSIDIILLIRNPFAVALSRQNKPKWEWFNRPEALLMQQQLKRDFLEPFKEFITGISSKDDFILKQILLWSVTHYIPLQQFRKNQIQIVFYEDLVHHTSHELYRIETALRNKSSEFQDALSEDIKYRPSKTTSLSSKQLRKKSPSDWKNHINEHQLTQGNMILEKFGLNFLYDENGYPAVAPTDLFKI